jgi:CTP synthase (UTP-ammonia lyase)
MNHPEVVFSGVDQDGAIRIIEINTNDFFISTLFVPQTQSTRGNPHPLIKGFIKEAHVRVTE